MARKILVFVIKRDEVNDKLTLRANDDEFRDVYRSLVVLGVTSKYATSVRTVTSKYATSVRTVTSKYASSVKTVKFKYASIVRTVKSKYAGSV